MSQYTEIDGREGTCLASMGDALFEQREDGRAIHFYKRAVQAFHKGTGYKEEAETRYKVSSNAFDNKFYISVLK